MNGRELMFSMMGVGLLITVLSLLAGWRKRAMELSAQRFDLLAEALRDPTLDAATRAELLRSLARSQRGVFGWLWDQVQKPVVWRVLWFGSGWLTMLLAGAALGLHAAGIARLRSYDLQPVIMITVLGFGMVTLPLALRELLRRDRLLGERR